MTYYIIHLQLLHLFDFELDTILANYYYLK